MTVKNNDLDNLNISTGVSSSGTREVRINWGVGIVIAFAFFIAFILYFVFKVQLDSKYDNELVVKEYYKHDASFGNEMVRIQNAQDLVQKPVITNAVEGIRIVFPAIFVPNNIKGKVTFYRSSNEKLDFDVPILLSNSTLVIPKKRLLAGQWEINMEWQYEGKSYLTKEKLFVNP